jgi:hypothetical protein
MLFNVVVVLYVLRIIWKDERGSDKKNKSKLERMKNQWAFSFEWATGCWWSWLHGLTYGLKLHV